MSDKLSLLKFTRARAKSAKLKWRCRCIYFHFFSAAKKKRNNFAIKRAINQTSFFSFIFFSTAKKKTKQKKRRHCISELNGKFIVLKTKIQKLASLKQSEFFNVFLTIFSYSEIRRWIYNKVHCANICYLLMVIVCSNGVFYPNVCVFYPRFLTTYSYLIALKGRNKIDRGEREVNPKSWTD